MQSLNMTSFGWIAALAILIAIVAVLRDESLQKRLFDRLWWWIEDRAEERRVALVERMLEGDPEFQATHFALNRRRLDRDRLNEVREYGRNAATRAVRRRTFK